MTKIVRLIGPDSTEAVNAHYDPLWTPYDPTTGSPLGLDMLVFQPGVPALASELNLLQSLVTDQLSRVVEQMAISGFTYTKRYPLEAQGSAGLNYDGSPGGNQYTILFPSSWFMALGKMIHIADDIGGDIRLYIGTPPSAPNTRHDLLYLEFWFHEVGAQAGPHPDASDPTRHTLYVNGWTGGTAIDVSIGDNQVLSEDLGTETAARVQLRWRFRIEQQVDFNMYPWGLSTLDGQTPNTDIVAQAGKTAEVAGKTYRQTVYPEANTYLWLAGDGSVAAANALNTVDGFSYAVPLVHLERTNTTTIGHDLRTLSRMHIPARSIHSTEMATYVSEFPGVQGAAFEDGDPANDSNIKRSSIAGGVDGDIAAGTITTRELSTNLVTSDTIAAGAINITHLDENSGTSTLLCVNATLGNLTNGDVVYLDSNVGLGTRRVLLPSTDNYGTTQVGVVANYTHSGTPADIPSGQQGYVRFGGWVTKVHISGTVNRGQYLITDGAHPGQAKVSATRSVNTFARAHSSTADDVNYVSAFVFSRVPDNSIEAQHIVDGTITHNEIAPLNVDGPANTPSMRTLGPGSAQAVANDDARLTNSRAPTGAAGGKLAGTYPNPTIAAGAVGTAEIAAASIAPSHVQAAYVDGNASAASLRTLNGGSGSAAPFVHSHGELAIGAAAGGSLTGTYPNPLIRSGAVIAGMLGPSAVTTPAIYDGNVTEAKIGFAAVTTDKIATGNVTEPKIPDGNIIGRHIAAGNVQHVHMATNAIERMNIKDFEVRDNHMGAALFSTVALGGGGFSVPSNPANPVEMAFNGLNATDTGVLVGASSIWSLSYNSGKDFRFARAGVYSITATVFWAAGTPISQKWYSYIDLYRAQDGDIPDTYIISSDAQTNEPETEVPGIPGGFPHWTSQTVHVEQSLNANSIIRVRLYQRNGSGDSVGVNRVRVSIARMGDFYNR